MAFGGVSAMFFGGHVTFSMAAALYKVDLRSMFFATVFMIILLVLAYLTNPSETSFRTYLTEQSFRQHLSRLDENSTDDSTDPEGSGVHFTLSRRSLPTTTKPGRDFGTVSPFHFVNRASVSLRTPRHVFYSFGIFTVAAVYPPGRPQSRSTIRSANGSMVSDSWFLGAFGKWWRGGVIQPWWREMFAHRMKDTERCTSGILTLRALDSLEGYDGLPFSTSTAPRLPTNNQDSPRLRGTERSAHRVTNSASRSTTPPPLPKSASLPLHAPRTPTTPPKADKSSGGHRHAHSPSSQSLTPTVSEQARLNTPHLLTYSASATSLFDQSPVIAEILRQISLAKTGVHDLRTQLTDFRAAASESHAAIQSDLDAHRERKRAEDAARLELKTRTKALEDAKRSAEGSKRDAEKRLKAAESARDSASQRIERLDKEIGALQEKMKEDAAAKEHAQAHGAVAEQEMTAELELKKKEVRVAEDVVAALNVRARELEERVAQEEERLKLAREQAELRRQDRSFYPLHVVSTVNEDPSVSWPHMSAYARAAPDALTHLDTELSEMDMFPQVTPTADSRRSSTSAGATESSISPRPGSLPLGAISNFREHGLAAGPEPVVQPNGHDMRRAGYPLFDDISLSSGQSHSTRFAPFSDEIEGGSPLSPRTTSLIPSSLINSLEGNGMDGISRSFQSDDDTVLARDWRKLYPPPMPVESPATFSSSPTSITCPSFDAVDQDDPFEIRPPPVPRRLTADAPEMQHAAFPPPARTTSEPQPLPQPRFYDADAADRNSTAHRRWLSASPREKKGLNPEAKVFQLHKKPLPAFGAPLQPPPFDPLGAAASASALDTDALFSSISMRAFAPSPAEREALQRALGGSTNTSLERLPTLSEVAGASMPPSPNHVHASAAPREPAEAGKYLHPGLSWLQSLPRMRKPKFSPWEDEAEGGRGGGR
ncbi:hypothetical protein OBBRIDRAFT_741703 [Obba rivulosa]|uniref:Proteophosphoglycan ppg4 n=1 Tax=Obba rivulosa TaxID=1052685 RepID=A0A8E2AM51_9APHY|nr:hypothetical protein OBBRIDRAFT_741703 [Obba rivulosa]